jgi:hypothetical protein
LCRRPGKKKGAALLEAGSGKKQRKITSAASLGVPV